jgi:hypothetical protein
MPGIAGSDEGEGGETAAPSASTIDGPTATGGAGTGGASDGVSPDSGGSGDSMAMASSDGVPPIDDSSSSGGEEPPGLVDRGLLTRYFIAEAEASTGPPVLLDSAPDPLDLPIDYADGLAYDTEAGHRGLRWPAAGDDGRVGVAIEGTKLSVLDGSSTGTIEVVAMIEGAISSGSRLSHIGTGSQGGLFSLMASASDELEFRWQGETTLGDWSIAGVDMERAVYTAVLDTGSGLPAEDRLRLYVNGTRVAASGNMPSANQTISIDTSTAGFAIGNRLNCDRSPEGMIFYAALYSVALSDEEVAANAAYLAQDDDGPS